MSEEQVNRIVGAILCVVIQLFVLICLLAVIGGTLIRIIDK